MFTVKEVAERLRISATCVYQLVERGKLACHRIGLGRGAIRISEADLTAFLEGCRRDAQVTSESARPPCAKPAKFKHLQVDGGSKER